MRKKKGMFVMKKYISLMMVAVLFLSMFAGCKDVDKNKNKVNGKFSEYLIAEKVGTVNRTNFNTAEGGLYYLNENNMYGVISLNGVYDTGAVYASVNPTGKFFQVRKNNIVSGDIANLNSAMLIDGKGSIIVSGYAYYYALSERYVQVFKLTGKTLNKDSAIVSLDIENGYVSFGSVDGREWYEGSWQVFDVVTGKTIPGVSEKEAKSVEACGRFIEYFKDGMISINEKGEALGENSKLFDDGSYSIESKIGEVFSDDGELMFSYDLTGFKPSSASYGYYIASKYEDGTTKYVVMDNKGKVISSEFTDSITIYGEVIMCGDKIYNLKGENIISGTYEYVYYDQVVCQNWLLKNGDYYTLIDKNGNVFFNGASDGNENNVFTTDFVASKKTKEGDYYFYSYKENDYTIKGYSFAPWIVKSPNANNLYDLVDTMTGEKLLEGYNDFSSISKNTLSYYVYAKHNGGADVYLVVSSSQLEEVITKKNSLYDELTAAFSNEGINVTINKETGEIALDSSVLFGGDSAELTADGKAFLNKFIRAYTSIVTSDKYTGFISKTIVEGHTAPVSGSTYAGDIKLSEDRANNVKNYCISTATGVDVSKISSTFESIGYSNSKPVYDSNGNVNMAASRRVSFRFLVNVDF